MREMKNRLLAIEAELQTLYRETGDESEVSRAGHSGVEMSGMLVRKCELTERRPIWAWLKPRLTPKIPLKTELTRLLAAV